MTQQKLRITEVFYSLQGETSTVGLPTVFVRLTGCPLRCQYCDTAYAFQGGELRALEAIMADVSAYGARYVTVTGGEPLAQPLCLTLLTQLCDAGFTVSLETSGAMDVSGVDPRVVKILDLKTPGSQEMLKNRMDNLQHLTAQDQVKFVICDREDYDWAKRLSLQHDLFEQYEVLFSPSYGQVEGATLADWMLADRLPARFQVQLHKILWGDAPGK